MEPSSETPHTPRPRLQKEYEDPHYHDDIEVVPVDDVDHSESRPPVKRKSSRRPPPRRHYED